MYLSNVRSYQPLLACALCLIVSGCSDSSSTPTNTTPVIDDTTSAQQPEPPVESPVGGTVEPPTVDMVEPGFSALNFDASSSIVDNPYFPLVPGTASRFEGQNEEGELETIVTSVSHETRIVDGIESIIVVDRAYESGELVEETFDWYAQDMDGNVWYMGEASYDYEDGEVVSTQGSWESGVDVDNTGNPGIAGIIMKSNPTVGDTYQHEIYTGIAEDGAEVSALDHPFTFANGSTVNTLRIREFNPLEPDSMDEYKYYQSGFGLVAEENVDGTERIELIESSDQRQPNLEVSLFSQSTLIDHPYLPLVPGDSYTYEVQTDEGLERIVVEVLDDTRVVAGITARVVRDRVFLDDVLIEDTFDWFAQDDAGNVWYMGEEVDNYEYDDNGELLEINNDGAWESGVDGAQPGITMPVMPRIGDSYRQEYLPGEAEDLASVVGLDVTVVLRDGATYQTLMTRDWNPLDAEAGDEFKYYAQGVGLQTRFRFAQQFLNRQSHRCSIACRMIRIWSMRAVLGPKRSIAVSSRTE